MEHHHHEADEHSKYEAALALYETNLSDDEVKGKIVQIIEKYVKENNTQEVKRTLFNCLDLTTLKTEDNEESVLKLTERVNDFEDQYPDLRNFPTGITMSISVAPSAKARAVSATFTSVKV